MGKFQKNNTLLQSHPSGCKREPFTRGATLKHSAAKPSVLLEAGTAEAEHLAIETEIIAGSCLEN